MPPVQPGTQDRRRAQGGTFGQTRARGSVHAFPPGRCQAPRTPQEEALRGSEKPVLGPHTEAHPRGQSSQPNSPLSPLTEPAGTHQRSPKSLRQQGRAPERSRGPSWGQGSCAHTHPQHRPPSSALWTLRRMSTVADDTAAQRDPVQPPSKQAGSSSGWAAGPQAHAPHQGCPGPTGEGHTKASLKATCHGGQQWGVMGWPPGLAETVPGMPSLTGTVGDQVKPTSTAS